jgi:hypothetical protein
MSEAAVQRAAEFSSEPQLLWADCDEFLTGEIRTGKRLESLALNAGFQLRHSATEVRAAGSNAAYQSIWT